MKNMNDTNEEYDLYYVPEQSKWPIIASIAIFLFLAGIAMILNALKINSSLNTGYIFLGLGSILMLWMLYGWFADVVHESRSGLYSGQMDRTFHWGMFWFIFSEVMLFFTFFGALFYVRVLVLPELAGISEESTHDLLWSKFNYQWPLLVNPDNTTFKGASSFVNPFHLPLLNTIFLVLSSVTLTIAHHNLREQNRSAIIKWLFITILLGFAFLICQVMEYTEAYNELGLTLNAGIYGSTFFLLTGFHGAHVTIGAIMLLVMLFRVKKGHFESDNHFGFEAASWYWHFVDVVWICLFIFVYIL
jgi:cytochrome c oxidase subunit 3